MGNKSAIEWTDATWNPVQGCTKVSPGCQHCYAETWCERFRGTQGYPDGFDLTLKPHKLLDPLRWRAPRRVFVNSMSDLFHGQVPDDYITQVWDTMAAADWHVYQVLTKRAKRMRRWVKSKVELHRAHPSHIDPMPRHIWLGVSVEDRKHGLPRIDELRETPAAVRFLSVEPLLEDLGTLDLRGIDWVIVGGESGHGARRMEVPWVENIQGQCLEFDVPFFFKQWGAFSPSYNGRYWYERVGKKKAGRSLGGRTWDAMPELARAEHPGHREARRRLVVLS